MQLNIIVTGATGFVGEGIGLLSPRRMVTLQEIGQAMINAVLKGYPKQVLEMSDIKELARA